MGFTPHTRMGMYGGVTPMVEEIEELTAPTEETLKAKIVKIERGKLGELIDVSKIKNAELKRRYEEQADRDAIQLTLDVGGIQIKRVMIVSLRPNSRFYRLMKKYKKLKVGDEIDVAITKSGRLQIVYD